MICIEAKSMSTGRQVLTSAALIVFTAALCNAQNVVSAHSGTVHYFEGDVSVDGVKLAPQVARFTELKEQSVLNTGLGRAEILLTPGVLLRVGENSSIRMLDNRLLSTRVEFLSGIAMVESDDPGLSVKDPAVTIVYKDFEAQPLRFGLFEVTSEPGQVRVFKGEAKVTGNGTSLTVKDGNLVNLSTTMAMAKFDAKQGDDLYLWSRDRSAYLAAGNMASARALSVSGFNSGYGYSGAPGWNPNLYSGFSGGWYYNQNLNMYSYMPFAGTVYGPFGYGFYNPVTVYYAYAPSYFWAGSGGSPTGNTTGVPLASLPVLGTASGTHPQPLPRLNVSASLRPSLASPARGTEPGARTALLSARMGGGSASNTISSSASGSVKAAAPVAAAPSSGGMARAGGGKR
jgi:hypothetical protein